ELSEPAKAWLVQHGYDEQMGARPMARVIQEHIKKPLADEVLFGKLKGGGHVRVVLVKDEASTEPDQEKIGFEYVEGPVTPKPEKLPGARKRTVPRKPKPNGPSGGSKGPASRGPLVKA
nr:ATP-dependent Clp protease ATP-binding subunit ClpA [Bradyrhizobium sp.]